MIQGLLWTDPPSLFMKRPTWIRALLLSYVTLTMSQKAFSLFSLFNDCINVLSQPFSIIATKMSSFLSFFTTDSASVSVEVPGEKDIDTFELLFLSYILLGECFYSCSCGIYFKPVKARFQYKNFKGAECFFVQFYSTDFSLLVSQQKVC